jgi:hypothetical protein
MLVAQQIVPDREVLTGVDPDDVAVSFDTWERHLKEHLDFPFEAEVDALQERGPMQGSDRVTVMGISRLDYTRGVIVHVRRGGQWYNFPLCDLTVLDTSSLNHDLV